MSLAMTFKMAWESVISNKMRSFLTMLGNIIGVAAVIILVSIMQGMISYVSDSLDEMGTTTLTVTIGRSGSNRAVQTEALYQLVEDNDNVLACYSPTLSGQAVLKVGAENMTTGVTGVNEHYQTIRELSVQEGRLFTYLDDEESKRVIVIGAYNANEFFGSAARAVGQRVKMNGEMFTVIGVLEEEADAEEGSSDDVAYIPYSTATRVFKNTNVSSLTFMATSSETVDAAESVIERFLYQTFGDDDAYSIMNMQELLDAFNDIMGIMSMVLAGIAGISLVVAGIGIMNIMLVSVTERTREIGIRKSIGAKRRSILLQFLVEAVMISLLGGLLGVLLGFVAAEILGPVLQVDCTPTWGLIGGCLLYSLAVGIFFGIKPASKASKLNPIEALRAD